MGEIAQETTIHSSPVTRSSALKPHSKHIGRGAGRSGPQRRKPVGTPLRAQKTSSDMELTPCDQLVSWSIQFSNSACVLARSLSSSSGRAIGSKSS